MVWSTPAIMATIPPSELFSCSNDTLVERIHRPVSPVSQGDPSVTNQPSNIGYNLAVISPEVSPLECVKFPALKKNSMPLL